jgi:Mce-associated membrane protein
MALGLITIGMLGGLIGWLAIHTNAADEAQRQRARFLEAGRQSAIMLTTVKHDDVDSDVKHIVDSSTGVFLADFHNRSQAFVDTVRRTQSNTQGTIAEAGLESVRGDQADVLVVVSVKTSLAGTDSPARLWRMRVAIQKVGHDMKLSNVEFIA